MADTLLVAIECRRCDEWFALCLSCYRGHAYCSDECRDQARQEQEQRARAEYLRSLGPKGVRDANRERKRRSRQPEPQGDVTDQTPTARAESVGTDQRERRSQAVSATAAQGSDHAQHEATEQRAAPSPGPRQAEPVQIRTGDDSTALATLVRQQPSTAAPGNRDGEVATAELGRADVQRERLQHLPPGAVPGRCSHCGKLGWLVGWVLPADAQQRSLRRLLATRGP